MPAMSMHGDELTKPPVSSSQRASTNGPVGPLNMLTPVWRAFKRKCGHGARADGELDGVNDGVTLALPLMLGVSEGESPPNAL